MDKKLIFKTGRYVQIWIAMFATIGTIALFVFLFVLALIVGQSLNFVDLIYPISYPLSAIWLIYFLVILFHKSTLEVSEKGMIRKTKKKILWEIEWTEVVKMSYSKLHLIRILLFDFSSGVLVIFHRKEGLIDRSLTIKFGNQKTLSTNLFPKDVKKIISEFGKEIDIS